MSVKLISYSKPDQCMLDEGVESLKDLVSFCAKVSNPSNQISSETAEKLVKYLAKNKHWSPFEMVNVCLEIETTRDIARQILRHRSFSFQEFCLSGDTDIYFDISSDEEEYKQYKISDLYDKWHNGSKEIIRKMLIKIYDENEQKISTSNISDIFFTGKKEVFKITISEDNKDKEIKCTKEHKFLSKNGFDTLEHIIGLEYNVDNIGKKTAVFTKKNKIAIIKDNQNTTPTWIEIKNIEYIGEEDTYDIEVEHTSHNYVANGFIVHNSQRYADPTKELTFITREARLQDMKNRQNSVEIDDKELQNEWNIKQQEVIEKSKEIYNWAISKGIAKEQARCVLPEGNTMSRMYVNGTLRSWIHYCELRGSNGTQKEHIQIAQKCSEVISNIFPLNIL